MLHTYISARKSTHRPFSTSLNHYHPAQPWSQQALTNWKLQRQRGTWGLLTCFPHILPRCWRYDGSRSALRNRYEKEAGEGERESREGGKLMERLDSGWVEGRKGPDGWRVGGRSHWLLLHPLSAYWAPQTEQSRVLHTSLLPSHSLCVCGCLCVFTKRKMQQVCMAS